VLRVAAQGGSATVFPLDPYPKVIITAALTGMLPTRAQTPHVPLTEGEIVADALACRAAGAAIVHLHVRDEEGMPDYRAQRYGRIIRAIRAESDLLICASTSARVYQEYEQRAEVLCLDGVEKPDLASLTAGSFNFPTQASVNSPETIFRLAEMMIARGIKPEIEVFDAGMLNYAKYLDRKLGLAKPLCFTLLLGSLGGIPGRLGDLSYLVHDLPDACFWSATGIGSFQLPINMAALVEGGGVRVGLEDNIYYDHDRRDLATNRRLVERIVRIATELQRRVATPDEARIMLGLPVTTARRLTGSWRVTVDA
jgi:3-keto-5-aminohexanoate cleavage enzyme